MNRRRKTLLTTAAMTLAAAFATGSALAMAESNDSASPQIQSSTDARYPASQALSTPDQAVDSQTSQSPNDTEEDTNGDSMNSSNDSDQDMNSSDQLNSDEATDNEANPSLAPSDAQIIEAPREDATAVSGSAVVIPTRPMYVFPPDQPRYTPETGDAQYGSKLDPIGPTANRFNDATGQ